MRRNPYINFSNKFPKLTEEELQKHGDKFVTIRTYASQHFYPLGVTVEVTVNSEYLYNAKVTGVKRIKKEDITETLAWADACMTAEGLKNFLTRIYGRRYGPEYDDYIVITLKRIRE